MKMKAFIAVLAVCLLSLAATSRADRYERGVSDSPYRLVGYIAHPIGIGLEYAIMRPVHWLVSQPDLDIIFGHQPDPQEEGTYFEWTHGDYTPSIADERPTESPQHQGMIDQEERESDTE